MLNRCSENYIETTSKEHVEIPSGKRRQKNFHFQPVCQRCFNATGHIGLTLNQRQNACRVCMCVFCKDEFGYCIVCVTFIYEKKYKIMTTHIISNKYSMNVSDSIKIIT